ncbi:MAG: trypsin-like peptidase domain-containing protein [Proteobacteria bacterium]|nr:trypsin-like peptidase domain-containing protein [Pseudomonadota bacterium]
MRRVLCAAFVMLALAGCASPSGEAASGFIDGMAARAFIPVTGRSVLLHDSAAAFVIEPGIAVTNAHVADFLGARAVIGRSRDYDLMFFRVENNAAPAVMAPAIGENVIAYGTDLHGGLRVARGVVRGLDMPVETRCRTCNAQTGFVYIGDAGPGFSGGPVLDAASGALVGITFGYDDVDGQRRMYAYPMSRVRAELDQLLHRLP